MGHVLAGEHRFAQRLALNGVAVGLHHRQRTMVEFAAQLELRQRALPLAGDRQQLEEKDAQLRVGGVGANLLLQIGERRGGVACAQSILGGGIHVGIHAANISSLKVDVAPAWPTFCCCRYSTLILLNTIDIVSTALPSASTDWSSDAMRPRSSMMT